MDTVISQIQTLSTRNDGDLKKLKDFLRHEHESLKANVQQIDGALRILDPTQHTIGIAFLLAVQLSVGSYSNKRVTFTYIGNFLKLSDEQQVKKASVQVNSICKSYAQMAIDDGPQAMLRSAMPLLAAVEKLRPNAETLTPAHAEFMRVCLESKAYHLAAPVLEQPIFDIALSNGNCTQMTPQSFLSYFYFGAMIRIGMEEYSKALQLLLVVLTCPASCENQTQVEAYRKFALVSLKVKGELQPLPMYSSHIVQSYSKNPGYVLEIVEAFKQGDAEALRRIVEEKENEIQTDDNMELVELVISSLKRHKLQTLTKTYLTLSLGEIAQEVGFEESKTNEVECLLFDMISSGEINARIDLSTGNVSFEDELDDMDAGMVTKLQDKLQQIMELAQRISAFEHEVVSSEPYIRKTAALEGGAPVTIPLGGYDFMDM